MKDLLESMNKQLIEKGKEILEYKEKHPGCFVNTSGVPPKILEEEEPTQPESSSKSTGILTGGKT